MDLETKFFHSSPHLKRTYSKLIDEIHQCVDRVKWEPEFSFQTPAGKEVLHQTAYNKALEHEFKSLDWEPQPLLLAKPRLIGDFRKHLVFVEIQFGNSATLYRDYYKFQYGLANGFLSLAVLIVPTNPKEFFPTRPVSVQNMAEYDLAERYLTLLPINVPTLLVGLLPGN